MYDVCIIGGGINGVSTAQQCSAAGYNVVLFEQHKLANGASSATSKLAHGGLRYLENLEISLVKESLIDQEESEFEEQVQRNGTFEYKVLFVLVMLSSISFLLRVKLGTWLLWLNLLLVTVWSIYQWDILVEQPRFGVVIDTRQSIFSNQNLLIFFYQNKYLRIYF